MPNVYAEGLNPRHFLLWLHTLQVNSPVENIWYSIHLLNISPDINKLEAVAPPPSTQQQNYTTVPISTILTFRHRASSI